jgi:predicted AAA+ superfamily ATPase
MIPRLCQSTLSQVLENFPAVALLGPRQVGKTTLALELIENNSNATYLDLENPADKLKVASDPTDYFSRHSGELLVLDEIHRVPELFPVLRGVIDRQRRRKHSTGQFLLLGSASMDLLKQSSESLAGRLITLELTPFLAPEVQAASRSVDALWVRGGFPDSYLAKDDAASFRWRTAFIQTYLERDIPALGPRIPSETLRRFWTMLAGAQGSILNHSTLAQSVSISGQTVTRYLDLLVDLLLVRRLQPWSGNVMKRLTKRPKAYVRDSGLVHALLGLPSAEQILSNMISGPSWEGFAVENILSAVPNGTQSYYYRTGAGAEIDLVLDFSSSAVASKDRAGPWAIEIKRNSTPSVSRGFHIGCSDINAKRKLVVYPGNSTFSLGQQIEAIGLLDLVTEVRELE